MNKRKRSKRFKTPTKERVPPRLPNINLPWRLLSIMALSGLFLVVAWHLADKPVRSIVVNAPFQRVTALQIEDVVKQNLKRGLLSTDLSIVRQELEALQWIDEVRLRRSWPETIVVGVSEQRAAARWGDSGLLNIRGELFVEHARHIPSELPLLIGPDSTQDQVTRRYLELHSTLLEHGFQLLTVALDERGAWRVVLSSGVEVRLGRDNVDQRITRFLKLVTPLIAGRARVVDYIDMRYANGFAIGWAKPARGQPGVEKDV